MRGTPNNSGTKGGIGINSKPKILVRKGGLEPPRFYPPDPKLSRFAGVSEAGARRRNPERSRRIPMILVRKGGLEPPRFYPPDPKSGASANSATFAASRVQSYQDCRHNLRPGTCLTINRDHCHSGLTTEERELIRTSSWIASRLHHVQVSGYLRKI